MQTLNYYSTNTVLRIGNHDLNRVSCADAAPIVEQGRPTDGPNEVAGGRRLTAGQTAPYSTHARAHTAPLRRARK